MYATWTVQGLVMDAASAAFAPESPVTSGLRMEDIDRTAAGQRARSGSRRTASAIDAILASSSDASSLIDMWRAS